MENIYEPLSIGGYPIIKRLGSGGMSTVYEALDPIGMRVALKRLHPFIAEDPDSRARLRREVEVLKKLRGPHIAQILDAELDESEIFIVTELIDGLTLTQEVQQNGRYTEEDLIELGKNLAAALGAVHELGIMHRDLKPSNVMMSARGPVLIDFGIAQSVDATRYTVQGMLAHTPGYCDPRVVRGTEPDMDADWWALAAVLAFAANGAPPFGREVSQILHRTITGEVQLPNLDVVSEQIFSHALAPNLNERISFADLLHYLEHPDLYERDWGFSVAEGEDAAQTAVLPEVKTALLPSSPNFPNLADDISADVTQIISDYSVDSVSAPDSSLAEALDETIIEPIDPTLIVNTSWNLSGPGEYYQNDPGGYYRNLDTPLPRETQQSSGMSGMLPVDTGAVSAPLPQTQNTSTFPLQESIPVPGSQVSPQAQKLARAPFVTLFIGVFLGVLGARWPGVVFVGYFVLLVLLVVIGRSYRPQSLLTVPGGARPSRGVIRILLRFPMDLISALFYTAFAYLIGGILFYLLLRFGAPNYQDVLVEAGVIDLSGQLQAKAAPILVAGALLWMVLIWFLLRGRYHRIGARVVLNPLLPTPWFRFLWAGIFLTGAALVYLTLVDVTQIDFSPFSGWILS